MPSPLAHCAAGYAVCQFLDQSLHQGTTRPGKKTHIFTITALSLIPDLDFLSGLIDGNKGKLHNSFSHSVVFGILTSFMIAGVRLLVAGSEFKRWFVLTMTCYTTHLALDLCSSRRGLMLLWPFSSRRFATPVKLFYGFRWKAPLVSKHHLRMILTESLFVFLLYLFVQRLPGIRGN